MVYLFAAAIMFVVYLIFKAVLVFFKRSTKNFQENKQLGKAEVVGYYYSNGFDGYNNNYYLLVKVLDLNNDKKYICNSAGIDIQDYPHGTIVDVAYVVSKFGIVNVYLLDCMPAENTVIEKVFNIIAIISMIITLGLLIAGVITMIL